MEKKKNADAPKKSLKNDNATPDRPAPSPESMTGDIAAGWSDMAKTDTVEPDMARPGDAALKEAEAEVVELLTQSYEALKKLAEIRLDCKLSNTRVTGVAREIKQLIKVMSVYLC